MPALSLRKKQVLLMALLIIALIAGFLIWYLRPDTINKAQHQKLEPVFAAGVTRASYDVIVTGTDPEGITAAVSAARNGLKVLLVDGRNRATLGGLFTLGWLNSLDLNKAPKQKPLSGKLDLLDKGLFQEWYDQIEGTSFDVNTAANVFNRMVSQEANIDLLLKVRKMEPVLEGRKVVGIRVIKEDGTLQTVPAKVVIDATQDGDIAAASGVPYTYGREDLGEPKARMAVTLVFKLRGVTQEIWDSFAKHPNTQIDKMSGWGFPEAKEYQSSNPQRVKLRGLNFGRQNDDTILINAMHIYDVNPFDPRSVQEGLDIGRKEAPRITEYLQKRFTEFRHLKFDGTAPELYVRETRHILGEYRLKITDLMENRDFWDAIAYGSYEVDIQSMGPDNGGAVLMKPQAYGVPFRCLVPRGIDGMLVVGRAASFDPLPHGSARVVPLGMATGQAAGAAAKLAIDMGLSFRELSHSKPAIAELRNRLTQQHMDLLMPAITTPEYAKHPQYRGLLAAVSMSLTIGDKNNQGFRLDEASNALRFVYNMAAVKRVHSGKFGGVPMNAVAAMVQPKEQPLTLNQAAYTIAVAAGIPAKPATAVEELLHKGWVQESTLQMIADPKRLTNGDAYMLIRDLVERYVGVKYE